MGHINYSCLRGKVHAFAPAAPATNPHLWVLLEAGGRLWFATINVRSDKGRLGDPVGKSWLYYLIDGDFRHPIVASMLARPEGLSAVNRDYASGDDRVTKIAVDEMVLAGLADGIAEPALVVQSSWRTTAARRPPAAPRGADWSGATVRKHGPCRAGNCN